MIRRARWGVALWGVVASIVCLPPAAAQKVSGSGGQEAAPFDRELTALMKKYDVPGGTIAVARGGKLVVSRGYGIADRNTGQAVAPDTPFRIASLTKPLAAMATLALVDRGRITLDQPVAPILRRGLPGGGPPAEGRLAAITLRHLIQHTSGWGLRENLGFGIDVEEFAKLRAAAQGDLRNHFVRLKAAWGMAPVTEPGSHYAYSTWGYCTIGAALEVVEARPMDAIWSELLFRPAGVKRFGLAAPHIGEPRPLDGEARYYDPPGSPTGNVRMQGPQVTLPRPDAYWLPRGDGDCLSGGRLVMSAPDYLRVLASAGGRRGEELLSATSRALFFDTASTVAIDSTQRMTHGLMHIRGPEGDTWWHTGGMPGSATYYSRHGAFEWVALFNLRPTDVGFYREIRTATWRAVRAVKSWPTIDLF